MTTQLKLDLTALSDIPATAWTALKKGHALKGRMGADKEECVLILLPDGSVVDDDYEPAPMDGAYEALCSEGKNKDNSTHTCFVTMMWRAVATLSHAADLVGLPSGYVVSIDDGGRGEYADGMRLDTSVQQAEGEDHEVSERCDDPNAQFILYGEELLKRLDEEAYVFESAARRRRQTIDRVVLALKCLRIRPKFTDAELKAQRKR